MESYFDKIRTAKLQIVYDSEYRWGGGNRREVENAVDQVRVYARMFLLQGVAIKTT